ncbi:hypothetical protein V5420_002122 [Listeria monocytogenes]
MKKTYFMRCYPLAYGLCLSWIVVLASFILFTMVPIHEQTNPSEGCIFPFLPQLFQWLNILLKYSVRLMPFLLLGLLLPEIIRRKQTDTLRNLSKALWGTIIFRRFIRQIPPNTPTNETSEKHWVPNKTTVSCFNRAVGKSVLDITQTHLQLWIKMPREIQAQQLLHDQEAQIRTHIASYYPEYVLSPFVREKRNLWLMGTKHE